MRASRPRRVSSRPNPTDTARFSGHAVYRGFSHWIYLFIEAGWFGTMEFYDCTMTLHILDWDFFLTSTDELSIIFQRGGEKPPTRDISWEYKFWHFLGVYQRIWKLKDTSWWNMLGQSQMDTLILTSLLVSMGISTSQQRNKFLFLQGI